MNCFVCRKHRDRGPLVPGGPVAEDDLVMVSHLTPAARGRDGKPVYLGHLFGEPCGTPQAWPISPTPKPSGLAGGARARAAHVYAEVIGDAVPHLHVHLTARYPDAPREYWWPRVEEWPQARRGGIPEIEGFVRDLHAYLTTSS